MASSEPRAEVAALIRRARRTSRGFGDLRQAADEYAASHSRAESLGIARALYASDVPQARMIATYIFGHCAAQSAGALRFMRARVSRDEDWRVQEILAQAFDRYCAALGYERALPSIEGWLRDNRANVRRAASEGLRIWTSRPYFKAHPEHAVALLRTLRSDPSEYVRKSAGNALRDISRAHGDLVRNEIQCWDLSDRSTAQTYRLAARFVNR